MFRLATFQNRLEILTGRKENIFAWWYLFIEVDFFEVCITYHTRTEILSTTTVVKFIHSE
jgi:hypothetical protein